METSDLDAGLALPTVRAMLMQGAHLIAQEAPAKHRKPGSTGPWCCRTNLTGTLRLCVTYARQVGGQVP